MRARRAIALLALAAAAACTSAKPAIAPPPTPAPTASAAPSAAPSAVVEGPSDAGVLADAAVQAQEIKDAAPEKPAPVERTGKTWPFHEWDHAEALTFNRFQMKPRVPLRVYDDDGWNPFVVDRKPIDEPAGKLALDLALAGKGELEVTKCPFPRHAVVLYDGAVAIASINVCFECGDILLWPKWQAPEGPQRQKLHDQVFPKWKAFFRDRVGFSIDEKYH